MMHDALSTSLAVHGSCAGVEGWRLEPVRGSGSMSGGALAGKFRALKSQA